MFKFAYEECRPVLLDRNDSFEQLSQLFPNLVDRIVLFSLTSEFYKTQLQIYLIKLDVELVRLGILINGEDLHKTPNIIGQTSFAIEQQLKQLL